MRTCEESGCTRKYFGRGLCNMHWQRAKAAGTLEGRKREQIPPGATMQERLTHHGWTVTDAGCWEFNGARNRLGYGQLAVGNVRYVNGKKQCVPMLASRVAYLAWVGPIPDEQAVCHRCDNPPCINPEHLFLGTRTVNNHDAAAKLRIANGERAVHKLTDKQVEAIRKRYADGGIRHKDLAAEYGVSRTLITLILNRQRRRTPTNPPITSRP